MFSAKCNQEIDGGARVSKQARNDAAHKIPRNYTALVRQVKLLKCAMSYSNKVLFKVKEALSFLTRVVPIQNQREKQYTNAV